MARRSTDTTTREIAITLWEDSVRAAVRASDRDLDAYDLHMRVAEFLETTYLESNARSLSASRDWIRRLLVKP